MPKKQKSNKVKIELEVLVAVVAALVIIVAVLLTGQQNQTKISTVPAEIKSQSDAVSLEKDTSSILKEVGDALTNIDKSLPEV